MVASEAAQAIGLPPYVLPCVPLGQVITDSRAMQAPSGKPEAIPLAEVIISGSTPKCSIAHHFPVRPMPLCTSSAINRMPYLSHNFRKAGKNPSGGTGYP